eukprot:1157588-Pelagomonas_calceolata.AAC.5
MRCVKQCCERHKRAQGLWARLGVTNHLKGVWGAGKLSYTILSCLVGGTGMNVCCVVQGDWHTTIPQLGAGHDKARKGTCALEASLQRTHFKLAQQNEVCLHTASATIYSWQSRQAISGPAAHVVSGLYAWLC